LRTRCPCPGSATARPGCPWSTSSPENREHGPAVHSRGTGRAGSGPPGPARSPVPAERAAICRARPATAHDVAGRASGHGRATAGRGDADHRRAQGPACSGDDDRRHPPQAPHASLKRSRTKPAGCLVQQPGLGSSRNGPGLLRAEVLVHHAYRHRPLTHRPSDSLDRPASYVAGREHTAPAGLQEQRSPIGPLAASDSSRDVVHA
jgi:hypothetical protein